MTDFLINEPSDGQRAAAEDALLALGPLSSDTPQLSLPDLLSCAVEENKLKAQQGLPAWVHLDFRGDNIAIKMASSTLSQVYTCEVFLLDFDGSYAVGK